MRNLFLTSDEIALFVQADQTACIVRGPVAYAITAWNEAQSLLSDGWTVERIERIDRDQRRIEDATKDVIAALQSGPDWNSFVENEKFPAILTEAVAEELAAREYDQYRRIGLSHDQIMGL